MELHKKFLSKVRCEESSSKALRLEDMKTGRRNKI